MTALEIFKTILKWLQIMAVSYATGVLIASEIPKRKVPLCDKCAHLRFKRAKKTMCAADMSAIFGICHPLTIPQSFAIDLRRKNESTR